MAATIRPDDFDPDRYRGLSEIFEFINGDGRFSKFNCGQAAACTFLTHYRKLTPAAETMAEIERAHPPDNLGGWLGTSRRQVESICRNHELPTETIEGEGELRISLTSLRPVIVMLAVPGPKILSVRMPMGHWMVAYGFDSEYVYLSNYGRMTWDDFRARWHGFVPRLIRMQNCGLVAAGAITET